MGSIGAFILNQVLKMQWLSELIAAMLGAFGIDTASQLGGTLHFFVYDTVKIVILLCVLIFAISYIQSHFPPERSRKIMGRFKGIWANSAIESFSAFCTLTEGLTSTWVSVSLAMM